MSDGGSKVQPDEIGRLSNHGGGLNLPYHCIPEEKSIFTLSIIKVLSHANRGRNINLSTQDVISKIL